MVELIATWFGACPKTTLSGDFGGDSAAEFGMGPDRIVVEPPDAKHQPCMVQGGGVNSISLRHSSRSLPLKLSLKPFCCRLPGAM